MQVATTNLLHTNQLGLATIRSKELQQSRTIVGERNSSDEDIAQRRTDPDKIYQLSLFGRLHYALSSALKTNESIEYEYLLETIY